MTTSISEVEPPLADPGHPTITQSPPNDEKVPESTPEQIPTDPELGKILDTYA